MTRPARAGALTAAALSLLLGLTGCMGSPSAPSPAPSTSSVAEQTAEPAAAADPLEAVTAIVVRPEHLELRDTADTAVRQLSYDLSAAEVAAALSVVFGGDPVVEELPGSCCESRPTTQYHWDAFTVSDDHMGTFDDEDHSVWIPEDGPDIADMNLSVRVGEGDVRGIAITTTAGFRIGDDVAALATELGQPYDAAYVEIAIETGPELGPPEIEGRANAYSVVVQGPASGAQGFQLFAPLNLGVGRV